MALLPAFGLAQTNLRMDAAARSQRPQSQIPQYNRQPAQQQRGEALVQELGIPEENRPAFRQMYGEYSDSQRQIKSRFNSHQDYENMSDENARRELDKSFEVGQQLLDNRREYANKFQRVMKPQQVLRMFQTEGRMREQMNTRRPPAQRPGR